MNTYLKIDADGFALQVSFSETPPETDWVQDDTYPIMGRAGYRYKPLTKEWVADSDEKLRDEEAKRLRVTRLDLLLQSDWTQLPNNPLTPEQQTAWATYRQELRDIPNQEGYPFNVVWPVAPA